MTINVREVKSYAPWPMSPDTIEKYTGRHHLQLDLVIVNKIHCQPFI
jgi:hypothetical protein